MSQDQLLILRKILASLLKKGQIRSIGLAAVVPVPFSKKSNGRLCFCVDCRELNSIKMPDGYQISLFEETLRQLSKVKWFIMLDSKLTFHRIKIKEGDEQITVFRFRFKISEWSVTPINLVNVSTTFQILINEQLREYLNVDATTYMNDIPTYSNKGKEVHLKTVCNCRRAVRLSRGLIQERRKEYSKI